MPSSRTCGATSRSAARRGKPAILHCRSRPGARDAQDLLVAELRDGRVRRPRPAGAPSADRPPAIVHSFSGPVDYAETVLELGLAISFSGLVFRAGEEASADVARLVPARSPPGRDGRAVPVAAGRAAPAERAGVGRRSPPRWLAEQRGGGAASGRGGLVAAYDRILRTQPRAGRASVLGS